MDQASRSKENITAEIAELISKISALKKDLNGSGQSYLLSIEEASDAIFINDNKGNYIDANTKALALVGYSRAEILKMKIGDLIAPNDLSKSEVQLEKINRGELVKLERELKRKDGSSVFVEVTARALQDGNIEAILRDISDRKKLTSELQRSQERFQKLSDATNEAILVHEGGIIKEVNRSFSLLFGYTSEEILGKHVLDITAERSKEKIIEQIKTKRETPFEAFAKKKNGNEFSCEVAARTISYDNYEARVVSVRDTTLQKEFERSLRDSERLYRTLMKNLPEGVFVQQNGKIVFANDVAFEMLEAKGKTLEEIGEISIFNFILPQYHDLIKERIVGLYEGKNYPFIELKTKTYSGNVIDVEIKSSLVEINGEKAIQTIFHNITELKRTEHSLRESKEQLALVVNNIGDLIYYIDFGAKNERIVKFMSPQVENILGLTVEEYIETGTKLTDFVHKDDLSSVIETAKQLKETKRPVSFVYRFLHQKKKDYVWLEERVFPRLDENKNHVGNFGVTRDVTDLKKVQDDLTESESKFRMLAENALDIVYRYSLVPKPHYEYVSPSVINITGYTPDDFYADPLFGFKIVHPDDKDVPGQSEQVLRDNADIRNVRSSQIILRWITKDGRTIWTETHNKPIFDANEKVIAIEGISRDITERQRVEKELMESEEKFRLLSNSAPIGIFLTNFKGNPYYVNKKFEEITGLPYGRIVNNSWQRLIHPDDSPRVSAAINHTITTGTDYSDEFRVKNYLKGLRWVKFQVTAIKSEINNTRGWVGTIEDVTERYESENRYRQLFENNTAGVFRTGINGEVVDCNMAFVKIFGYKTVQEIKSVNAKSFYFTEEDRSNYIDDLKKFRKLNNYNLRVSTANGEERFVLANVAFHETAESGSYIEGTLIDITQSVVAERALKENERVLSTLMNNLPGMAYRCLDDEAWTMNFVSKGCLELTGHEPEDLVNNSKRSFSSIVHPDDREIGKEQIKRAIQTHTPFEIEYRIKTASGKIKWVWEKGEGVFSDEGKLICLEGFITDITDRKHYEAEIQQSRENYKNLIDTSPIGVFIHDEEGKVIFINPAALTIMGISSMEEFNEFHMFHFVLQDYHDVIRERKKQLKRGDDNLPFVITKMRRPDGKVIDVESKATPIVFMGKPAIQVVCRDITYQRQLETERLRAEIAEESNKKLQQEVTERKNAERILSETQKYTRMLIDSSLDMICASDKQGFVTEFNFAAQKTFGYSLEEVLGKHVSILYANPKERIRITEKHLYKEGAYAGEVTNRKKSGELFTAYLSASVLKNKDGEIVGAMGVSRDITEIKKSQEQLRLSEERYRAMYSQAYIGIAQIGKDGSIIQANDQYCKILGYKINELIGKTINDITHPDDKEQTKKLRNDITKGKVDNVTTERKYLHKNGTVIYASLTISLVRDAEGKPDYSITVIQDITEKKKAEEQIRLQAAKMNSVIESSTHLIWTVDENIQLTSFNHNYAEMLKDLYAVQAKVGLSTIKGKMVSTNEYNSIWVKKYEAVFNGLPQHFETSFTDKKGNVSWREVYLNPIFGGDGLVKEVSGIGHDVTEKKFAEERIKQSLHEKEVLLKEVHHRVKNNLQVISSILNLQSSYVKDEKTLAMLRESQNRIKSMAFIHESLYQTKDFSNINFSEYVTSLSRNLVQSYEISEGNIELQLDIDNIFLNLDQSIPCGLIINELITNSLKYAFKGKKKGIVTVAVKKKGENLSIAIGDNGVGLSKKVDFRNTESLGLQLVVTLTEQLSGKINLDRTKGTKFTISFKQQQIKTRI